MPNLPESVQTDVTYRVLNGEYSDVTVHRGEDGNVFIGQDGEDHLIHPAALSGLIATLQAIAGQDAEPAFFLDSDGDEWTRQLDGRYTSPGLATRAYADVVSEFGRATDGQVSA